MIVDALKVGLIVFLAAVAQTAVFSGMSVLGGVPDILLVTLVAVALVRGATTGAVAGFCGGLLIDIALLADTLGMTSLLLTLVGYWTGRYGETALSGRRYAPYLAVAVMSVLFPVGKLVLLFTLGETAPAREVLVDTLLQSVALNLLLTWPIYAMVRWLLPRRPGVATFGPEVSVVG